MMMRRLREYRMMAMSAVSLVSHQLMGVFQAVSGALIDHMEADPLGCRCCRVEADGTTEVTNLQVTFPLSAMGCHVRPSKFIPEETKRRLLGSGALV